MRRALEEVRRQRIIDEFVALGPYGQSSLLDMLVQEMQNTQK